MEDMSQITQFIGLFCATISFLIIRNLRIYLHLCEKRCLVFNLRDYYWIFLLGIMGYNLKKQQGEDFIYIGGIYIHIFNLIQNRERK